MKFVNAIKVLSGAFLILFPAVVLISCGKKEKESSSFLQREVLFKFDNRWKDIKATDYPEDFGKSIINLQKITKNEVFLMEPDSGFSFEAPVSDNNLSIGFDYGIESKGTTPGKGTVVFSVGVNGEEKFSRTLSLKRASKRKYPALKSSNVKLGDYPESGINVRFKTTLRGTSSTVARPFWRNITISKNKRIQRVHSSEKKPNVILIMVDALRWDHLGYNGYERNITPFIDKLTGKSLVFDNAFSTCTWTCPSVASLMTSRTPFEHGVYNANTAFLSYEFKTLPEYLQQNGFTTMAFSGNPLIAEKYNYGQGFEVFSQFNSKTYAEIITEKFLDKLETFREYRFFAYIHLMEPHMPYKAPYEYMSNFTDPAKGKNILEKFKKIKGKINRRDGNAKMSPEMKKTLIDLYDAEIQYLDYSIKKLISSLKKMNIMDKTAVIFIADHGEEFLEHGSVTHGGDLYNTKLKIPMFIYYPSQFDPGRSDGIASIMDVYPTVGGIAGTSISSELRGENLGEKLPENRILTFFNKPKVSSSGEDICHLGILDYPYKLFRVRGRNRTELYNLKKDPGEMNDISTLKPDKRRLLEEKLKEKISGCRVEKKEETKLDKETKRRLKSLGYIK